MYRHREEGRLLCEEGKRQGPEELGSYLLAHIDLLRTKELGSLRDLLYPARSTFLSLATRIGNSEELKAIVDSGAQLNVLSATVATEQGLKIEPLPKVIPRSPNGSNYTVYGGTVADVRIVDSRGREQTHRIPFVVTDLKGPPVFLGLPWIDQFNPKLNFRSRRMLFRGVKGQKGTQYAKVALEDANEFSETMMSPDSDVYVCSISSLQEVETSSDPRSEIRPEYREYADVALPEKSSGLAPHGEQDLAIELQPGTNPPHQPLYNLSTVELEFLRKYLEEYLQRGWIRRSRSSAGAPILFAKKKDGGLRLCVDYRGLNKITIKNRHPLPLISESLDRLSKARWYTKLDIRDAYHRIRIRDGDEWKTAFRTRYGHFEYLVMPFGLTNAPAAFQAYINQALAGLVDVTCIVYLDDILVFSDTEEEHVGHVKEVLQRLREAKLYLKLSKCEFHTRETEFLGYIVCPEGVKVDPSRVATIQEWPMPRTVRDIRVFIGFMNYYRRFIANFSQIALPLTTLTQKGPDAARGGHAQRREESQPIKIEEKAKEAFKILKKAFLKVPILAHFDQERQTKVEVDASGGAICGILSQLVPDEARGPQWRPIDFFSRKMGKYEYNYDTHDKELLAIDKSLEHWRRYLQGTPFELFTDHKNLRWFMETKVLNYRQVRAYERLTGYNFVITHRAGKLNPADGPSRRPDYIQESQSPSQKGNEAYIEPMRALLSRKDHAEPLIVAVITRSSRTEVDNRGLPPRTRRRRYPLPPIIGEEPEEVQDSEPAPTVVEELEVDSDTTLVDSDEAEEARDSPLRDGMGRKTPKVLTTDQEKAKAFWECHDSPLAGHFGSKKTLEKLKRQYDWRGIRKDVEAYCNDCLKCRRSVAVRHRPYGLLNPLPPPESPWSDVTMDFITELPPSKYLGQVYDAILVTVDRLTKMAHYIPARGNWEATDLAQAWIREVVRLHGTPKNIISDRGPLMSSKYWDSFCHYLGSMSVLSSAYHPETDGQTERQNQTLEQYLRCYCSLEQDDWAIWLPIAEFAYNDSLHATTGTTPFRAYHGVDPRGPDWPGMPLGSGESHLANGVAARVLALQSECRRRIIVANEYQKKYADRKRKHISLRIGDKVLVSNRHIRSTRPKKKLDWKYLGPGTVLAQIGRDAYRVDLPGLGQVHPVFHVSLLEPYVQRGSIPSQSAQPVDTLRTLGDDVYYVEEVLDRRKSSTGGWEYLVKWEGYPSEENSWEPGPNISAGALNDFWKRRNIRARRSKKPASGDAG
jgi:hypothetical protein